MTLPAVLEHAPATRLPRRSIANLAILAAAGIALAGHLINPYHTALPHCPFHTLTGLWCPACGVSRSTCALMHGNMLSAFRHNILFLPAVLLLLWELLSYSTRAYAPTSEHRWMHTPLQMHSRWIWALPITIALFWVVRNIPGAPEHLLSPY